MRNTPQHTPGPWRYTYESAAEARRKNPGTDGGGATGFIKDMTGKFGGNVLAYMPHSRDVSKDAEAEANARLMAASPALYAALHNLVARGLISADGDHYDEAIEALALVAPVDDPASCMGCGSLAKHGSNDGPCPKHTAPIDSESAMDTDAAGIRSSALFGVISIRDYTPKDGQCVLWIWDGAGQITAGDYFDGKPRDAAANYTVIDTAPTHWMPWPSNWPNDQADL